MKTPNLSKTNKKELLRLLGERLKDKGATKAELNAVNRRFDDLMVALKERLNTQLLTKIDHNVIVDNLEDIVKGLTKSGLSITNFKDIQFPPFPKKIEADIVSKPKWYKEPSDTVGVKGVVKVQSEDTTTMLGFFTGALQTLITFLGKLQQKTFLTVKPDSEYMKPQAVVIFDPLRREVVDIKELLASNKGAGGPVNVSVSGGGSSGIQAQLDTLDQYKIADGDEAGTTKYYGFLDKDGNWYILKNDTTANSYRYTKGSGGYAAAWTARASKTYNYYDVIF